MTYEYYTPLFFDENPKVKEGFPDATPTKVMIFFRDHLNKDPVYGQVEHVYARDPDKNITGVYKRINPTVLALGYNAEKKCWYTDWSPAEFDRVVDRIPESADDQEILILDRLKAMLFLEEEDALLLKNPIIVFDPSNNMAHNATLRLPSSKPDTTVLKIITELLEKNKALIFFHDHSDKFTSDIFSKNAAKLFAIGIRHFYVEIPFLLTPDFIAFNHDCDKDKLKRAFNKFGIKTIYDIDILMSYYVEIQKAGIQLFPVAAYLSAEGARTLRDEYIDLTNRTMIYKANKLIRRLSEHEFAIFLLGGCHYKTAQSLCLPSIYLSGSPPQDKADKAHFESLNENLMGVNMSLAAGIFSARDKGNIFFHYRESILQNVDCLLSITDPETVMEMPLKEVFAQMYLDRIASASAASDDAETAAAGPLV